MHNAQCTMLGAQPSRRTYQVEDECEPLRVGFPQWWENMLSVHPLAAVNLVKRRYAAIPQHVHVRVSKAESLTHRQATGRTGSGSVPATAKGQCVATLLRTFG